MFIFFAENSFRHNYYIRYTFFWSVYNLHTLQDDDFQCSLPFAGEVNGRKVDGVGDTISKGGREKSSKPPASRDAEKERAVIDGKPNEGEGAKVQEVWARVWDADQGEEPQKKAGETY